ncbi:alpha-galactosidase [Paenibacillus mucilaginosus]|uniref:Alpha-galactosidase n=1 Tax=Paenibacillus mucilaginosus (strain KNP414) TaxID=1036673 RepID=F8FE09_PAEMK|nr:alpha-galactosidase [Paenibacillus mucilaginosus]AEI43209.1 glycoside hydrolase [Paenibacillus mucilaginosus KNP414]MCG7212232.1 alpha-galactosidase [Paenibacillus mucilaginosus]WDM24802.1 alpha-galactosidase [Paenibacillus mucilaginosus]
MPIIVDEPLQTFHLKAKDTSYILQIVNGYPVHVYWGQSLREDSSLSNFIEYSHTNLDRYAQEYPQYGSGDFRSPAYQVQLSDGSRITELVYRDYRVSAGKPKLEGLPSVYVESDDEAETLELTLTDEYSGLKVLLRYTVFAGCNAITRSAVLINEGHESLRILRALSASVDMEKSDYDMLYLAGAWTRETQIERRPLGPGSFKVESRRGMSSHQLNPFLALLSPDANEDRGEVYGFSLVYSGNFTADAEVDSMGSVRVSIGINPFEFAWQLEQGASFQTPEAVMVYSADGLGAMSRTYHKLYRTRLCRGVHRDLERPILVNNWEATYFDFTADKLEAIAKSGAELGIELFVLDDGWFGKRNDDTTSLGDWVEDRNKLPDGLNELAGRINRHGLQFGLWVEPEMVSPDSDLYRSHPDWCLHVEGRRRTLARTQLVLDFSRQEVRDYIFDSLSRIFSSVPVAYIKWDMNRGLSEIGSAAAPPERQMEIAHRYVLGLYELLERLTSAFPHILFESCSSGGGRFDPGMLYYMPQTWTSDNTDAVERLKIQYGTSMVYPISTIGAHVSAVPNHQVGRLTPLTTRGDVAMSGNFGYELDLTKFTEEEKDQVAAQVTRYKRFRPLVQQGEFFRLKSPFTGNETAWMFVSEDQREALVCFFRVLAQPNPPQSLLRLKGLNAGYDYVLEESGEVYGGDRLMHMGLILPPLHGDFTSKIYYLKAEQTSFSS